MQIIVIIQPDGNTKAIAEGFEGSQCRAATAFLKDALGSFTTEQLTEAYFQVATTAPAKQEARL
ncbi:MAG TPA: DUF2997 domain-containing protein [Pirellulaceae bacterium]|nr:DUF2997 domain-containing protein [Pirellulaceae bacterium]